MYKSKQISSKDVAKEAGVSQATVSYVINNVKGISIRPETREAVLNAAKKLNYHPNLIAAGMRLKKSMSIGVVTDKSISNYMFTRVLEGIRDVLVHRNYSITLCLTKSIEIEESEHVKYYRTNRIDGIIFVFASLTDEHIAYLTENGIPFVIIHSNIKNNWIHLVKTDMYKAINEAIYSLVTKGIKNIGYIGASASNFGDRRFNGYINAMEAFGLNTGEHLWFVISNDETDIQSFMTGIFGDMTSESTNQVYAQAKTLPGKTLPGGILCETNQLGANLLRYFAGKGIRIPGDISVIAIGTSSFSTHSFPPMSTIEAPLNAMGEKGAAMLLDLLDDKEAKEVVVLEWEFVQRESS